MKIALVSDTHFEFGNQDDIQLDRDVDVLVLAGDIGHAKQVVELALRVGNEHADNIVVVFGNHEFYGTRIDKAYRQLNETLEEYKALAGEFLGTSKAWPTITLLNDTEVRFGEWTFLGGTWWTDFSLNGNQPLAMIDAEGGLNDYRRITIEKHGVYRKLRAKDVLHMNVLTSQFILDRLFHLGNEGRLDKTVVVTHHAPTDLSLDPDYQGSSLNPCYVNNWGNRLAYEGGPALWFHGHTHRPHDYVVGDTRVVCNPYGYPGQLPGAAIKYMEV